MLNSGESTESASPPITVEFDIVVVVAGVDVASKMDEEVVEVSLVVAMAVGECVNDEGAERIAGLSRCDDRRIGDETYSISDFIIFSKFILYNYFKV